MPIPTISSPAAIPNRSTDTAAEFAANADDFVDWLGNDLPPELNGFAVDLVYAAAAAGYSSVSTSSVAIGTGAKSFDVEQGKMYVAGAFIMIADVAAPTTNRMLCEVTSYNISTGALVVNCTRVWGSGTKTAWVISLSGPQGEGTNFSSPTITGTLREDYYTISDGASVDIDPANGSYQRWTLGANRTPTATNLAEGDSIVLKIADGTAYAVTWSTIGVVWVGGVAPTLPTSGFGLIVIWKDASTVYGKYIGAVAS